MQLAFPCGGSESSELKRNCNVSSISMFRTLTTRVVAPLTKHIQQNSKRCLAVSATGGDDGPDRFEKSVNQVSLLGRVGRDAETRGTEAHPVVVFSLATNNVYSRADGKTVSRVDWHRISVFKPGLREKVAANLKKGDRVFVSGVLRYDDYTDGQENPVRATTILANDIVNLTKRYRSEGEEETASYVDKGF